MVRAPSVLGYNGSAYATGLFMNLVSEDESLVVAIVLTVTLLLVCMLIGHFLRSNKWVNESITSLILGVCAGAVVYLTSKGKNSHILQFSEDLFFYYLLPPIIFNAGFQVKKKQFFKNFVAIMLFGVVGVFISFAIITILCKWLFVKLGLHLSFDDFMALGVIFSATDSVCVLQVLHQEETPLLYSLVFGEGVMNDAASVVLFNTIQSLDMSDINAGKIFTLIGKFIYLFLTSTLLGISVGLLSAIIIKKLYVGRHSSDQEITDREIAIMVLMPYLSYMLAELLDLSGILTVFLCGVVMSHYTWHNVTAGSRTTTRHAFATMSFIAETFIFLYVGMDSLDQEKWQMTDVSTIKFIALSGTLLLAVLVGRAAFVFPLSAFSNLVRRTPGTKIKFPHQVIIWWAGLMRGAVSIALAYAQFTVSGTTQSTTHATVITSTIIVVLFSTVVFGLLTKPLVVCLIPHASISDHSGTSSPVSPFEDKIPLLAPDSLPDGCNAARGSSNLHMIIGAPTSNIHHLWRMFDDKYMQPIFRSREH